MGAQLGLRQQAKERPASVESKLSESKDQRLLQDDDNISTASFQPSPFQSVFLGALTHVDVHKVDRDVLIDELGRTGKGVGVAAAYLHRGREHK